MRGRRSTFVSVVAVTAIVSSGCASHHTTTGLVLRVDRRVQADSASWLKQLPAQRQTRMQQLQQQRVQMYLQDIRQSAKVDDRRKKINASVRRGEGS